MIIRNLKSQSSMEFFIFVGMAFLAVTLFLIFSVNEVNESGDTKELLLLNDLALKLQKEVTIAADAGDGYARRFTLPDKLENAVDYSIQIRNNTITVISSKAAVSAATVNVTGDFTKGDNKIEKNSGRVYINTG